LTFCFLDRTQGQIGFGDRKKIEGFLRSFVPLMFLLDPVKFNAEFAILQDSTANLESDASDDVGSVADDVEVSSVVSGSSRGGGRSHRKGASSGGDLRKKLLKSEQAKSTGRKTRAQDAASPSTSRFASPALTELDGQAENRTPASDFPCQSSRAPLRKRNSFFTNTVFYVLLRLLEVSRLLFIYE
jgi:paired amphipathic helix protein Sin3a